MRNRMHPPKGPRTFLDYDCLAKAAQHDAVLLISHRYQGTVLMDFIRICPFQISLSRDHLAPTRLGLYFDCHALARALPL